jgi:cysteinyl-tRNA synthetase
VGGKVAAVSTSAQRAAPSAKASGGGLCLPAGEGANSFNTGGWHGPCCFLGQGFAQQAVERPGRAPWLQPTDGVDHGIMVMNSLTGEKERFVPKNGNNIRWYNCGPTVYDVSHMGHARAYLTFDILRRIIKDYFKYDVFYSINITDIDDKIILRSRQNKLFKDFTEEMEKKDIKALIKVADEAMDVAEKKLTAKKPAEPTATSSDREKSEFTKLTQEHALKLGQFGELKAKVAAAKGSKSDLLATARDPLMAKLDKERGHLLTDHAIFDAHARHFEDDYFEDMDALGVERPNVVSRISDYMDGRVQKFIEKLEDEGFCYGSQGSVYFNIDAFNNAGYHYRKLVPATTTSAAEMEEGEGALADEAAEKKNPNDFAVWKKSKPGEPAWESRWGQGRPGWHIECSVMATDVHKEFLDIHGGGEDLKFPHHDNEMAQTEAYLKSPQWVNYFWHAGHLSISGLKMSKSLKNFITIKQALAAHSARSMRVMFLMQPWDSGMNYSDQAMDMAKAEERKFKHVLGCLRFYERGPHSQGKAGDREAALLALTKKTEDAVGIALRDNFCTSKVIEVLSKLATECYASFEALPDADLKPVKTAAELITRILGILGVEAKVYGKLVPEPDKAAALTTALDAFAGLRQSVRQLVKTKASMADIIGALVKATPAVKAAEKAGIAECAKVFKAFVDDLQAAAKANKPPADFLKRCDEVRDRDFITLGVRLEDKASEGFIWMFDDREALQREIADQAEKAASAARAKIANKLAQKRTDIKVAEKAAVKPADLFRTGANAGLYDGFDEAGLPSKLKGGEEISAKKKKDFVKDLAKHQKEHEKLQKQAGDVGIDAFVAKLLAEAEELERQIGAQ